MNRIAASLDARPRVCLAAVTIFLLAAFGGSAATYDEWVELHQLEGADAKPGADPDEDLYPNALEYFYGTSPATANPPSPNALQMESLGSQSQLVYGADIEAVDSVTTRLMKSKNLDEWEPLTVEPSVEAGSLFTTYRYVVPQGEVPFFYRLEVTVTTGGEPVTIFGAPVTVGSNVGSQWEGLPALPSVVIRTEAPPVSSTDPTPNTSKFPEVVGTSLTAFTEAALAEASAAGQQPRRRSWLGWFLWGNGTPPPGVSPGYPVTDNYNGEPWDFFSFQYSAKAKDPFAVGEWKPLRVDQAPLYANPLTLHYAWPPGQFGYVTKPLKPFPNNTQYWQDKTIVRGPNVSQANPFFYQYGDRVTSGAIPDTWRESFFFSAMRPLETLVIVPGNRVGDDLLQDGTWNNNGTVATPDFQPFPYPVWDDNLLPKDQTPFAIQVDRIGDWDTDLIWEGTNTRSPTYATQRYQRSTFNAPGIGNYLKMTVAQGSPYVWCETNNNKFVSFYNLIRTNLAGQIANNTGTDAGMVPGGPFTVPGVTGVKYVLFYGDHTNPNQWYHQVEPWFYDAPSGVPGGFNPPGKQHNFTYTAVFYRDSAVTGFNSGTDSQGNPFGYLEFANAGKNWFVVGAIPVMHYYHTGVTVDGVDLLVPAARAWADELGKYAFNFLTGTKISYAVTNMDLATTTFATTVANPYVATGAPDAAAMTASPTQTVMCLQPHQYQPLTLGPDLTKTARPQVLWNPLGGVDAEFPIPAASPPNANKSTPEAPSRWDYWSLKGNLKTIISAGFTSKHPFQNFLPVMPPPDWARSYQQTGLQAVNITDVGTGNRLVAEVPTAYIKSDTGSGATLRVLVDSNTGKIQQINVISQGSGYPDGLPPTGEFKVVISSPSYAPGRQATAYAQVGGGNVLAVFMSDTGAGYSPTIQVTQEGVITDPAIIIPNFDGAGNMLAGPANVISNGAGFDFSDPANPPKLTVVGTGKGAVAEFVKPQSILSITDAPAAGFTVAGSYPSTGDASADAARINVRVPPPVADATAQTASVSQVNQTGGLIFNLTNQGKYTSAPTASFTDENNKVIPLTVDFRNGEVASLSLPRVNPPAYKMRTQATLVFSGGNPTEPAAGTVRFESSSLLTAVVKRGQYASEPTAKFVDDDGVDIPLSLNFDPGSGGVINVFVTPTNPPSIYKLLSPKQVIFSGGDPTEKAVVFLYPVAAVSGIALGSPSVGGYATDVQVNCDGGIILPPGVTLPEIAFAINPDGTIDNDPATLRVVSPGTGWTYGGNFRIVGGRGYDALVAPILNQNGTIISVKVLRGGNNYLSQVYPFISSASTTPAQLDVVVENGSIKAVNVANGGAGYKDVSIQFVSSPGGNDPVVVNNPKGAVAEVVFGTDGNGGISALNLANAGANYLPGTEEKTTPTSPSARIQFLSPAPAAVPGGDASGYIGKVLVPTTNVQQVFVDTLTSQYTNYTSANVRPFGGGFGGAGAPDGYGLGNQLSASTKFIGDLFNLQQFVASPAGGSSDQSSLSPSDFAINAARTAPGAFEFSIYQEHSPLISLSGALKSSVQGLQRTVSLLHSQDPYGNNPSDPEVWQFSYFSLFDTKAGRVVINPTATIPVLGVVSSNGSPPSIPDVENASKTGLNKWTRGALWSGFGVSDQWNDQHYFYGYYLGTAALAAMFDGSWETTINGKPPSVWADPGGMGTAVDQWLMTLAYDPDNTAFDNALYKVDAAADFKYQKFSFFDQWNGHGWATGTSPGRAGDVEDGKFGDNVPWSVWNSFGTGSFNFDGENENSIYEGIQAWSAAILWGGATERKAVVDVGIYLLTTEMAAGDQYFLDKNYNFSKTNLNAFSWAPVTTVDASAVNKNGGNTLTPANSDYNETNPAAFYTAPEFFGGAASAGQSLIKKTSNTLNNFFYAYPTGSKFIQAYPPSPWTLSISRHTDYMRRWAGSMMRQEWTAARNSALFQPANWLAMATTAALAGVPYNPGDTPYPLTGTQPNNPPTLPYITRLMSSWVTLNSAAGADAAKQPAFTASSVLSFLLSLDYYGTPDWTYIAKATDSAGAPDDTAIVFSAVFSKVVGSNVQTTLVGYNPGWTTRYAHFYRLNPDGSTDPAPVSGAQPMTVLPKKLTFQTLTIPIN